MKPMKKAAVVLLALVLAVFLAGCNYPELYERVLIHGIGVDWDGQAYQVTVRSSSSAEDEGEELFTCHGSTVLEALSSLSLSTGREPFYSHNYLVVFGMNCARRGLDDCLDFFVRYYNTRPSVSMFLAENTAEEVLSAEKDGKLMKMSQLQALGVGGRYNGKALDIELLDFVNAAKSEGAAPVLPVLAASEEGAEAVSTAYFQGYKVKGILSLDQTRGYLAAMGQLEKGELVVESSAGTVTLSLRDGESRIRLLPNGIEAGDVPEFAIEIQLDADVSAISGRRQDSENFYSELEEAAAQLVREQTESVLAQAMREDRCDVFDLSGLLYRKRTGFWREHGENWQGLMPQCPCRVEVGVKVRRLEEENLRGLD